MSDDLVKRLRMMPTYSGDPKGPHWLPNKAADRIEELEAKLAKAVEMALDECPFRWGTPNYDNWWRDRRATLAEIKGESHE